MAKKERKPFPFRLAPFFIMQFACNAIYQNYLSNYLRTHAWSDANIGRLLALVPIAGMAGQMLFGRLGDRVKYKNTLLIALALFSAASFFCFGLAGKTGVALLMGALLCVYAFFAMSSEPLMNAIALESLDRTGSNFGPIRSVGTYAFALCSPLAGMLIDNDYTRVIYLLTVGLLLLAAAGFLLPKVEGHAHRSARRVPFRQLLKQKNLLILTGFCFLLMISFSMFYTFYPIHFTSAAVGGTSAMLGWSFFLSACSETPFLIFSDRIFKKLGVSGMLTLTALALTIRLTLLGSLTSPWALLATQLLHGWGFVVITFSMAKYINLVVPMELKASGQMFFTLVALTLARSIGSLIGGGLSDIIGLSGVFLAAAAFAALLLVVFAIMIWKMPDLRRAGREQPAPQ